MAEKMPSVDDYYDNMYQNDLIHRELDALGVTMDQVDAECDRTGRTYDQQLEVLRTEKIQEVKQKIELDRQHMDVVLLIQRSAMSILVFRDIIPALGQIGQLLCEPERPLDPIRPQHAANLLSRAATQLHKVANDVKEQEAKIASSEKLLRDLKADQAAAVAANALSSSSSSNKKRAAPAPVTPARKSKKKQKTQV